MDAPRVQSIKPLVGKLLWVKFANGVEKIYDCNQILQRDMFRLLNNDAFFRSVVVDKGGYGISWDDEADLSEYELWVNSKELTSVIP